MTFKQFYQLLQVRLLYKIVRIPLETRKLSAGLFRILCKLFFLVFISLHYLSITSAFWSPLSLLKEQVQEFEQNAALYGERPGSVFIVEEDPLK